MSLVLQMHALGKLVNTDKASCPCPLAIRSYFLVLKLSSAEGFVDSSKEVGGGGGGGGHTNRRRIGWGQRPLHAACSSPRGSGGMLPQKILRF